MGDKKTSRYFDTFDLMGTRKQMRAAGVSASQQRKLLTRQKQQEALKLAEGESDIKRRQYMSRYGGRRSLMASEASVKGTTAQLGG